MSDRNSDPGPAAGNAPGAGYGLPNQAAPLPRQWQLQRGMVPLPPRANAGVQQQFYPVAAGPADWRPAPATRPTERAILVGLWLLVMLTAVAIGLRFLDLSALTVTPTDLAVRPAAAAGAADAARAAAYAAILANDDPMFDDPVPAPAPLPAAAPLPPAPVRLAAPAAARPGVGLAASAALAPEKPAKPAPAVIAQAGRPADACPDALRAMQLCSEKSR
jgi:hypothetical protein